MIGKPLYQRIMAFYHYGRLVDKELPLCLRRETGFQFGFRDGPYHVALRATDLHCWGHVSLCLRKLVNPRSRADGHIVMFALGKITSDDHIEDSTRSKCLTKAADANRKGSQKMGAPSKDGFRRMKLAEHRMLSESAKIFEQLESFAQSANYQPHCFPKVAIGYLS